MQNANDGKGFCLTGQYFVLPGVYFVSALKKSFFNFQKRRGFFRNISIDENFRSSVVWHISL